MSPAFQGHILEPAGTGETHIWETATEDWVREGREGTRSAPTPLDENGTSEAP